MQQFIFELCKLPDYLALRGSVFQSRAALDWYVRKHKAELVQTGALLLHCGQWHVMADKFDSFVLVAGARAAAFKTPPSTVLQAEQVRP